MINRYRVAHLIGEARRKGCTDMDIVKTIIDPLLLQARQEEGHKLLILIRSARTCWDKYDIAHELEHHLEREYIDKPETYA